MLAGTIITVITLPIYWGLHHRFGVDGLAWASNLAILVHTLTLAILLHRRGLVPLSGLDRPELARALLAALIGLAGTSILLRLLPGAQTYRDDILALVAGGAAWAALSAATLHFTGSKLLTQLRSRIG
jgi:putative peptidoglycan lipid II flippase